MSKYTVFSHKGGVRILEDNPHAHPRARVFLYGHLCFFLSRLPTLQCPLTSLAWGEKFLCSLRVIHLIWGPHKFSIFGESGSCSRLMTQASFIATCLLNANRLQKPSAPLVATSDNRCIPVVGLVLGGGSPSILLPISRETLTR